MSSASQRAETAEAVQAVSAVLRLWWWGLVAALVCACQAPEPREAVFRGTSMGTTWVVKISLAEGVVVDEAWRQRIGTVIERELDGVDSAMSTYRDDSELSRLNRHASGEPFALSSATFEVLAKALRLARMTDGAFDMTVGPLVDAWGFGPGIDAPPEGPGEEVLAALRSRVGYELLSLDNEARAALKARGDLHCDLSGIAKGFAVDRVSSALSALGLESFMVEVGGEVLARGRRAGSPWRIGIETPRTDARSLQRVIALEDLALATSGDYRNYREVNGVRLSHLIDPRDGRPIRHRLASVTVLHESCAVADALATGLMVAGPEAALALAEEHDLALFLLLRDSAGGFVERSSPAFDRRLAEALGLAEPVSSY